MVWESLDDETTDDRHAPIDLVVLPSNVRIVEVFQCCQPQLGVGMGVIWQGVSAGEVHAACVMSHIPPEDWPRFVEGVQLMAIAVADVRNQEAAESARQKRGR